VGGVPQTCVPGTPTAEVCNGVDDDCNGVIDDNRIRATCLLRPAILGNPPLLPMLSLECTFRNRCSGNILILPAGVPISATWISRADRLLDMTDNVTYPDPATLACPDPEKGTAFERGVAEDVETRTVQASTVTFRFDRPSDGDCTTLDGDKSAVLDLLPPGTPNSLLLVCLSGTLQGFPFEGCGIGLLLNHMAP
jgi:hypothetical protein